MIEIKRGATVVWSGKASGKQTKVVMQEDRVVLNINHASPVNFDIGDTIDVYGQTYKINRPENINRINTSVGYAYELEFEALYYDLGKWMLYTLDKENNLTEGDVFIMSDAAAIVDLIVRNANRASSGWSVGIIDTTEVQQYSYINYKLLTVLQDLADKNQLEFWVDGKTINLTRRQPNTGLTFEYGKGKGLYQVSRERTDDRIINSLRVLGGTRNLQINGPEAYGYRYLQPKNGNPLTVPHTGDVIEEVIEFANVYPRLIAAVTTVLGADYNIIRSSDIDFDINLQLLNTGESAKVAFTTGQLAGFVFTIQSNGYTHATRQIEFNRVTDDPAYPAGVPNTVLRPAIGDKFVLLDIAMPQIYITAQEAQLQQLGEQYLADYSVKRYNWRVSPTPKYILENNIEFPLGGIVRLKDTGLGIDIDIRIGGYTRDVNEPHLYDITLTNIISINTLVREANKVDRYNNTVSKGLSSDGSNVGKPTLASVTANGKITPFDMTTYGTYNTSVLGVPIVATKDEDLRTGFAHMWFSPTAPSGETPSGVGALEDLSDVNVAGKTNGQVLTWSSSLGKWVPTTVSSGGGGSVTSVGATVPVGMTVTGSPITSAGVLSLGFASGYSLPTTAKQEQWDVAYSWGDYRQFGLGSGQIPLSSDLNTIDKTSMLSGNVPLNSPTQYGTALTMTRYTATEATQMWQDVFSGRPYFRGRVAGNWSDWMTPYTNHDFSVDVNPTANTVVRRDGSGYVYAKYISLEDTKADYNPLPILGILGFNNYSGDYFAYQFSKQAVNQFLGMPAGGDTLQSVMIRGNTSDIVLNLLNATKDNRLSFDMGYSNIPVIIPSNSLGTVDKNLSISPFGGNVFIGKEWGSAKLDVAGTINADGRITAPILKATQIQLIPGIAPNTALMQAGEIAVWADFDNSN